MSTLMLSPCLYATGFGGVQRSGQLAWEALRESGRMLCFGRGCELRHGWHFCYRSKWRAALGAVIRRGQTDRILIWHLGLVKLLPLAASGRRRVYQFLHGVECWKRVDRLTERLLDRVHLFLSNSDYTWARFVDLNPRFRGRPHKTVALGLGDEGEPVRPPKARAAVIAGRMDRREDYKGHRQLIRIWPEVISRVPGAELWVIGEGDLRPDLEALSGRNGVRERIRFFGPVSEQEKESLLRSAACLAMPSRGEGFGLVYLEAMRLGRPCLVSTHDAGQEVVRPPEAGLAADVDDPRELAHALCRLLQDGPEWQAWSEQARKRYLSAFTARHFQARLLQALDAG